MLTAKCQIQLKLQDSDMENYCTNSFVLLTHYTALLLTATIQLIRNYQIHNKCQS